MNKIFVLLSTICLISVIPSKTICAKDPLSAEEIQEITTEIGDIYGICPEFLQAIAFRESSYDPDAENDGCKGLMQVNEKCHTDRMERLNVTDIYDPFDNVLVATDYLAELFYEYGEADVVLMFYNGNSRAEEYSRGIGEPSKYVTRILELSEELEREHGK